MTPRSPNEPGIDFQSARPLPLPLAAKRAPTRVDALRKAVNPAQVFGSQGELGATARRAVPDKANYFDSISTPGQFVVDAAEVNPAVKVGEFGRGEKVGINEQKALMDNV
jgi:hypothetical protein